MTTNPPPNTAPCNWGEGRGIELPSHPTVADLVAALLKVTDQQAPIHLQSPGGVVDTPAYVYHDRDFGLTII
jgi:hypothetical protein